MVLGRIAEHAERTRLVENDRPIVADVDGPDSSEAVAWRDAVARLRAPDSSAGPADDRLAAAIEQARTGLRCCRGRPRPRSGRSSGSTRR